MKIEMNPMFEGFTRETFEFFMAIRFNNNREFFVENEEWYRRAVRGPAVALAEELKPAIEKLDPMLETRSHKVVSRLNRDVRFSKDKSPYRDYIWIAFRRPGEERATTLGVFFDISDQGASFGMGFYDENKPLMNALRVRILERPEEVRKIMKTALAHFDFNPNQYKRMAIPDAVEDDLRPYYNLKGFYFSRAIEREALMSRALVRELVDGYELLRPLYQYIMALKPMEE